MEQRQEVKRRDNVWASSGSSASRGRTLCPSLVPRVPVERMPRTEARAGQAAGKSSSHINPNPRSKEKPTPASEKEQASEARNPGSKNVRNYGFLPLGDPLQ